MIRDSNNVVPLSLAVLLHGVLIASMIIAVDFRASVSPAMPLAITGTLVTENAIIAPPVVATPEPEPEPVPDTSEQDRLALEEQKRREDARIERERLARIKREAEQKRQAEEAEQKRIAAEAEKKRLAAEAEKKRLADEADKERRRLEAERKREAEIERQRAENERLRREAEATARQQELDAEARRIAARSADAKAAYMFAIQQRISNNWVRPPTATAGIECTVNIRQLPGGEVVSVSIGSCNGDAVVQRSIESAVHRASPLPSPRDPGVFDRNLTLIFKPAD